MNLLELVNTTKQLEDALIESGGELTPELEAMLAVKDVQLPAKVDAYHHVIDRLNNTADFYKSKADFYSKFSKSCSGAAKRLKDNIKYGLISMGLDQLIGDEIKFKLRNNKASVFIKDESLIPETYKVPVTVYELDKDKILADLKAGIEIPGAELLQSQSVIAYPNKT